MGTHVWVSPWRKVAKRKAQVDALVRAWMGALVRDEELMTLDDLARREGTLRSLKELRLCAIPGGNGLFVLLGLFLAT